MADCKIDQIAPHTIKKIELVYSYVVEWAQKLLNYSECHSLVFIDCMCNCGEYTDKDKNVIEGTGLRVARYLSNEAIRYPNKKIYIELNDYDKQRTDHFVSLCSNIIPSCASNFKYDIFNLDSNEFIKLISDKLSISRNTHFLLFYDPYKAIVNWDVLTPLFNQWGELIINHMVSDTMRTVPVATKNNAIGKLEGTYRIDFHELPKYSSDVEFYENLFEDIIRDIKKDFKKPCYLSYFPFFNSKNALVYDLVHCTSNIEGFKLYKKIAWQAFNGKSSGKELYGMDRQFNLFGNAEGAHYVIDEKCYTLNNVVDFIVKNYRGKGEIQKKEIWSLLDNHPAFPSDGFKDEITLMLKERGFITKRSSIIF